MSNDDALAAVFICLAVIVTAAVIGGFFYFTLVYNNTQNIKRDEFLASHCKTIETTEAAFGTAYQCGSTK